MVDKLDNRQSSQEETQIFNHRLALQPHCNADLYPRALAACLARDPEFLAFFRDPDIRAPDFEFEYRTYATDLQQHLGLIDPKKETHCSQNSPETLFFSFFLFFSGLTKESIKFNR